MRRDRFQIYDSITFRFYLQTTRPIGKQQRLVLFMLSKGFKASDYTQGANRRNPIILSFLGVLTSAI